MNTDKILLVWVDDQLLNEQKYRSELNKLGQVLDLSPKAPDFLPPEKVNPTLIVIYYSDQSMANLIELSEKYRYTYPDAYQVVLVESIRPSDFQYFSVFENIEILDKNLSPVKLKNHLKSQQKIKGQVHAINLDFVNQQYLFLMDSNLAGTFLSTPEGRVIDCNRVFFNMLGFQQKGELLKYNAVNFYPSPETREDLMRKLIRKRELVNEEIKLKRIDGKIIHVIENVKVLENPIDKQLYIIGTIVDISDYDIFDQEIRENQIRYKNLFESSFDAILLLKDGLITECNSKTIELLKRNRHDIVGEPLTAFSPEYQNEEELSAELLSTFLDYAKSGNMVQVEWKFLRNNELFYSELNLKRIKAKSEVYIQAIIRDISQAKAYIKKIEENEQRQRAMLHANPDEMIVIDREGHYFNYDDLDQNLKEGPHHIEKIFPESVTGKIIQSVNQALDSGDIQFVQLPILDNKKPTYLETRITTLNEHQALAIFRDVTEKVLADAALVESEERYRNLVETAGSIIVGFDTSGQVFEWNREAEQVHHISRNEMMGKVYHTRFIKPDLQVKFWEDCKAVMAGHHIRNYETTIITQNQERIITWNFTRLVGSEKQIIGFVGFGQDITIRRLAESALKESEERNRAILRAIPDVMLVLDKDGYYIDYFSADPKTLFMPPTSFLNKNIANILPESISNQMKLLMQSAADSGRPQVFEFQFSAGNEEHTLEVRMVYGGRDRFLQIIRNVTERKKSELELQKTTRIARITSECSQALVKASDSLDLITRICQVMVNTGNYRMAWFGYENENGKIEKRSLVGNDKGFLDSFCNPNSPVPDNENIFKACYLNQNPVFLNAISESEGFESWKSQAANRGFESLVCYPIYVKSEMVGFLSAVSSEPNRFDESEKKLIAELADDISYGFSMFKTRESHIQAEQKIRHQATLLDSAHDAIILINQHGIIEFWNKGAEEIFGYTTHDAMNESIYHFPVQNGKIDFKYILQRVLTTGDWQGELRYLNKNNEEVILQSHWMLMQTDDSENQTILVINTDMTEKKKLERQILHAQRMESIGTLASGVAHDLNNVLSPIMMAFPLLRKYAEDELTEKMINNAEASAKRGSEIVKQMLTFARQFHGDSIAVNPKHIIIEATNIIRETFPKSIKIDVFISRNSGIIKGDPTQIHQVLINLCVNARDAMPNGGNLTIDCRNVALDEAESAQYFEANPGSYVKISVADTGMGIPDELKERIFEPFFTTKEVGRGTGLGLSTVYSIIKGHKGFINLESELGKGTTFSIYFPTDPEESLQEESMDVKDMPKGKNEMILVVDDEEAIRDITGAILKSVGYRVVSAADGTQALVNYANYKDEVQVVILDMMMPHLDGPSTIQALRRMNPNIKIIGVSGLMAKEKLYKEGIDAGLVDFLTKPYTAEDIVESVRKALLSP